ncbi:SHOCT domain-containing protein [Saccharomonospora azurea]|nr:membrane protein [Saccharomonospora azurea]
MMWGYGPGAAWWMMVMPVIWLVLIGLIVWAVVALTRGGFRGRDSRDRPETPEDILQRRFAAGEIDADAYRQARETLAERHREPPR